MTASISLHPTPNAGFDEPFEMLLACHERVLRMLALLLRLREHLRDHGADEQARQAAQDVMRYFDQAGPAHHEDEERHLFPLLLARGGSDIAAVVRRLQQDHEAMTVQWRAVRADLQAIADGAWQTGQAAATTPRWQAYAELYAGHIAAEEGQAYPAARPLLPADALRTMGQEMAQRRGVPPPV